MKQGQEHIHKQNQVSLVSLKFLLSFLVPHPAEVPARPQPAEQKHFHAECREVASFVCCTASLTYAVIKMLITKQFKYMTDNAVKAYS